MKINKTKKSERLYYIDLLESLAIFLVISYHISGYEYNFLNNTNNILLYIKYFLRTILSTCVPLFFFINGYLLLNKKINLKKHIIKTIKIIILTILWGFIDLLLLMIIRNEQLSIIELIKGLWSLKQGWINYLWYMQALAVIYLLFPLIKVAYDYKKNIFYYFTIIICIITFGNTALNHIATILSNIIIKKNIVYTYNWFNTYNLFSGTYGYPIAYFCIGGIANEIKDKIKFLNNKKICIITILISAFLLFILGVKISFIDNTLWDIVWNGYDSIFTLINVICIYYICNKYKANNNQIKNIFTIISQNTLGIYFTHILLIELFKPYIIINNIFFNIIYTLFILTFSLLSTIIIKKIPIIKNLVLLNTNNTNK